MIFNPFYTILYSFALHEYRKNGFIARLSQKLYDKMINMGKGDSIVRTRTNKQRLICNFSHKLPFYQKVFPLYDRQLAKLCHFIHNETGHSLNIIDVGANVGDTVLNIGLKDAFYLLIEGNAEYSRFINTNLGATYNYAIENCYLTDTNNNNNYAVKTENGTAKLINNLAGGGIVLSSLDDILKSKYNDITFDLLKIDTDGFDAKVIRGATELLERDKPLLFFEWDRVLWEEQNEDPLSIFDILNQHGYVYLILFDNFGNYFTSLDINCKDKLEEYIKNTHGQNLPFYYDVLAVPMKNESLYRQIQSLYSNKVN